MIKKQFFILLLCMLALSGCGKSDKDQIRVGSILELTGNIPAVGASGKNAAKMAVKEINDLGGIAIADKKMLVKLYIEDDAAKADLAARAAQKLINKKHVVAIIGPNSSTGAIPAAAVAEKEKLLLIAPWSTAPQTTFDSKTNLPAHYVFRTCFTDPYEAEVIAHFAATNLHSKTAAILYNISAPAPLSQAAAFQRMFEKMGGKVVSVQTYTTKDKKFTKQLKDIEKTQPDILFFPAYYDKVPLIAKQARSLGLKAQFLGSDAWSSPDLISLSKGTVDGAYFANHYSPDSKSPVTQEFVKKYQEIYGAIPDDVAALTYDSYQLLFKAIAAAGKLDSTSIRDSLANLPPYQGVTGTIKYPPNSGDPTKTVVIMKIKGDKFVWVADMG